MAFLNRPTPEDAELAEFARSLRATFVTPTPKSQVTAIAPRLAEEARIAHAQGQSQGPRAARRGDSRLKQVGQLALGFCLVPLVAAGLATAGVKLPEPARSAFESVGIELPNQKEPEPGAPAAPQAPATPSGEAPAAAPEAGSGAAKEKPKTKTEKGPGKAKGKAKGQQGDAPGQSGAGSNGNGNGSSGSPGKSGSAPGRTKAGGSASSGSSDNGNAVGKTGATPPGQANKPASPGSSGNAPGKNR